MAIRAEKYYAGRELTIVLAITRNKRCPAGEFLEGLNRKDLAEVEALLMRLADRGQIRNTEQFRKEAGEIWALKAGQVRIACFRVREYLVLTHGFMKKQQKWPDEQLERAKRIRSESLGSV